MFVIEDEAHAESAGEYPTFDDALLELQRRASIPWNEEPNMAPCQNWKNCGREYEIIEYDDSRTPWKQLRRVPVLSIKADGVIWRPEFNKKQQK